MNEVIEADSEKVVKWAEVTDSQGKEKHGKGPIAPTSSQALVFPAG